ncbi:MAG: thioredoxin domain-containing protein [Polyangiaceae bacterium]
MNSAPTVNIDDENFDAEVLASKEPFLLDFTATWCGPCKALKPVVERLAAETVGRARVGIVDLDESPRVAARFGVRGAPTVLVFKGGTLVGRHVGTASKEKLLGLLALEP